MAYNTEEARRVQEAKDDLAKKLYFEKFLIKDLAPYYNKIKSSAKLLYSTNNIILDVSIYKSDLQDILKKHYKRVSKQFGNLEARQLSQLLGIKSASFTYNTLLQQYIDEQSQLHANYINTTDQQKLNDAFKAALVLWYLSGSKTPSSTVTVAPRSAIPQSNEVHTESGQTVKPQAGQGLNGTGLQTGEGINTENLQIVQSQDILKSVSETGIDNFNSILNARKELIALTETQNAAETSKALATMVYTGSAGITTKKQWISILDDRVRPWHAEAYGQVRNINEPYIVYGQELMYPGDTSLGATMDNIANCRCSSHYYW